MDDSQIRDLRRRIDAGEPVTNEEILAGLDALRAARANGSAPKPKKNPDLQPKLAELLAKHHAKNQA